MQRSLFFPTRNVPSSTLWIPPFFPLVSPLISFPFDGESFCHLQYRPTQSSSGVPLRIVSNSLHLPPSFPFRPELICTPFFPRKPGVVAFVESSIRHVPCLFESPHPLSPHPPPSSFSLQLIRSLYLRLVRSHNHRFCARGISGLFAPPRSPSSPSAYRPIFRLLLFQIHEYTAQCPPAFFTLLFYVNSTQFSAPILLLCPPVTPFSSSFFLPHSFFPRTVRRQSTKARAPIPSPASPSHRRLHSNTSPLLFFPPCPHVLSRPLPI